MVVSISKDCRQQSGPTYYETRFRILWHHELKKCAISIISDLNVLICIANELQSPGRLSFSPQAVSPLYPTMPSLLDAR